MPIVIIEGVDRIGKSSLANYLETKGYAYIHFSRPEGSTQREQALYQKGTFTQLFKLMAALDGQDVNIAMDRGHLGEMIYGQEYRPGSGVDLSYIHDLEASYPFEDVLLVLLLHRNLDVIRARDDGLGFDIANLAREQELFEEAWARSRLRHKALMDVTDLDLDGAKDMIDTLILKTWSTS